ncbi:MAG: BlaI/MecI/CopY family transcriptional regulator [Clostridia bacterium]|nr:BlaI/MecI/CopY family transcriptional regulator [Clostridia bacterium]
MNELNLGVVESRFADIIWQNEPITTQELVRRCEEALQWKRTTTYTVLKRLSDRGLFQNVGGTVTSLLSRDEFYARRTEKFVEETFDGSLPAFLAAFSARKALTADEVAEIRRLIDGYEEG